MSRGPTENYRFGDLLGPARESWIRQLGDALAARGYPDYRRSDAAVLRSLLGGPVSIGRLGDMLGITRQAARRVLDGLERRGLAMARPSTTDARRVDVTLTEQGARYANAITATIDEINRALARRGPVEQPASRSKLADLTAHPDLAPLVGAWVRARQEQRPFTIPGHKRRAGALWPVLGDLLDTDVPLYGGLDTVKQSAGTLAEAERRAAALWGGEWARFSAGGSTHGNQAMALAVARPGDTVLVARNAHRSTLLGLVFAGLTPVWLPVGSDPRFGIPTGIDPPALAAAIATHPEAVAVFLTEPAYLGVLSDLSALVDIAHAAGLAVVVDQAWGAHLGFHPDYPTHAMASGADAMVTSAHKTLLGYSQACLVVARLDRLDRDRLDRAVDAGHTTSPAGAILASIDASRAVLQTVGTTLLGDLARTVSAARTRLRALPGVEVPGPEDFPPGRFDPAKLVIQVAAAGVDGIAVERRMIADGFPLEMADRDTVVPIVTLADDGAEVVRMADALVAAISGTTSGAVRTVADQIWPTAEQRLTPRAAFFAERETVSWGRAAGRVCAEVVAPYPPGVAVLVPGEVITRETLKRLRRLSRQGTRIAYAADPSLDTVQVLLDGLDSAGR